MSFISVGDVIALAQLANDICQRFSSAPEEFAAISDTVKSFSILLRHAAVDWSEQDLSRRQRAELGQVIIGCQDVLLDLQQRLEKYRGLRFAGPGLRATLRKGRDRLLWDQEVIERFRSRISNHALFLNSLLASLASKNIAHMQQYQADQQHREVLDWLSPVNYAAQLKDCLSRCQEGTGQWFLKSPKFQKWMTQRGQRLFCPGIPGAGKTILTSLAVGELRNKFESRKDVGIAYVYFDFQQPDHQTQEGILASLLRQLVQDCLPIPEKIKLLYQHHKNQGTRLSVDELSDCLLFVIPQYRRCFILLDAIDECPDIYGLRSWVLSKLFDLREKYKANLLITSRYLPDIMSQFDDGETLQICAKGDDVRSYLQSHIKQIPSLESQESALKNEIANEITAAVGGMFLLARLHLESLAGKTTPTAIKQALATLPRGKDAYHAAYNKTMKRIESQVPDHVKQAKSVLSWIIDARRALKPWELCHALAVQPGETALDMENIPRIRDIVSLCAGLVVVDEESSIVRLVHHTAQQYLEQIWDMQAFDQDGGIALSCVTYLLHEEFRSGVCQTEEELKRRLLQNPLYEYAAKYWGYHARGAPAAIQDSILSFLKDEAYVKAACQVLFVSQAHPWNAEYSQRVPNAMTGLHLGAYFGLVDPVISLLRTTDTVNLCDASNCTPLSWAARNGHEELVRELLKTDGIDIDARDTDGRTPLLFAAQNGHEEVVRLLIQGHASANAEDNSGRTPISFAAMYGRGGVVELLASTKGVDIDSLHHQHRTPLSYASEKGHVAVVLMLLKCGSNPNIVDTKYQRTPLSRAAWNGRREVVEELLRKPDCNRNPRDVYGWTPLALAAAGGCLEVVEVLLNDDLVDVNMQNNDKDTPLSIALKRRRKEVVKLLLANGRVLVGPMDKYGDTTPPAGSLDERDLEIINHLRDRYRRDGCILPDDYLLHPGVDLENLITCNICGRKIPNADVRYHCEVCEDGDFYICQTCIRSRVRCLEQSHRVLKQTVINGVLVSVMADVYLDSGSI